MKFHEQRTILKALDGTVVVRPKAPEMLHSPNGLIGYTLNESGQQAWNNGEDIDWCHIDVCMDIRRIEMARL